MSIHLNPVGTKPVSTITGAQLLVEQLRINEVERIFCVPGESFLAVLDALVDVPEISVVTCRHEGGAAMMAEAYGKMTGRPGVVFVTRGPGATNGSSGVHVAHQDSTPMLFFIGQIERAHSGRGAFQEVDYRAMFAPLAKWSTEIDDPDRIPEVVSRAFHLSTSGRSGPVVISLPEDMLTQPATPTPARASQVVRSELARENADAIGEVLRSAKRPVLVVGGGGWCAASARHAADFASAWQLPVMTSFRCNDYVDNTLPTYVGSLGLGANNALLEAVDQSDVLLVVGARLGEASSNSYTLLRIPQPEQHLIHIHPEPSELGRVYQPQAAFCANSRSAIARLSSLNPPASVPWAERTCELRAAYESWTEPPQVPGPVQPGEVMAFLRERLPPDAIIANGAGNFATWPNRFYRYRSYRTMLAPTSGSMGYGVPAAIAAKIQHPERTVVAFTGDGDFLMTGQELATAEKEGAAIIVILINNGIYGTIRMHQEREYPERESGTRLLNPDFMMLARAYGAHGERITATDQFIPAFNRALSAGRSAVIEIVLDEEVLSPSETVTSLRKKKFGSEVVASEMQ